MKNRRMKQVGMVGIAIAGIFSMQLRAEDVYKNSWFGTGDKKVFVIGAKRVALAKDSTPLNLDKSITDSYALFKNSKEGVTDSILISFDYKGGSSWLCASIVSNISPWKPFNLSEYTNVMFDLKSPDGIFPNRITLQNKNKDSLYLDLSTLLKGKVLPEKWTRIKLSLDDFKLEKENFDPAKVTCVIFGFWSHLSKGENKVYIDNIVFY